MQKRISKSFLYQVLLPITILLLVYLLSQKIDLVDKSSDNKTKFFRNKKVSSSTINWTIGWSNRPNKRRIIEEFAREFEFSNQNISINLIYQSNLTNSGIAQNIVRMIDNNIFETDILWLNEVVYNEVGKLLNDSAWGKTYLVNFGNVEGFQLTQRSNILNNPYMMRKTDNILIGPIIDGEYGVLWFNQNIAKKLGVEVKKRNMTFSDLIQYAKITSDYNKTADQNNQIAFFCESFEKFQFPILFQYYVSAIKNKYNYTSDQLFNDSLNLLKNLLLEFDKLGHYNPIIESYKVDTWEESKTNFLNEKALFMVSTTDLFNDLYSIDSISVFKILPAELPVIEPSFGYYGSFQATYAVFKSSPNRNAAITALKSISTPNFANKWIHQIKNPSGIATNLRENYLVNDPYHNFLIYIAKKYKYKTWQTNDLSYLLGDEYIRVSDIKLIDENIGGILNNEKTPEEAFNNLKINISE